MATIDPAMTIAMAGAEGLPSSEAHQHHSEAPDVPLGAAASATAENIIPPEHQSCWEALLAHLEGLQTALRVEHQATRTKTATPMTTGAVPA